MNESATRRLLNAWKRQEWTPFPSDREGVEEVLKLINQGFLEFNDSFYHITGDGKRHMRDILVSGSVKPNLVG